MLIRKPENVLPSDIASLWSLHSFRLRIAFLIAWALVSLGLMRVSLSMAMVCMARNNATMAFGNFSDANATSRDTSLTVSWTVPEQGRIHTGYYIGAVVAVFTADRLIRIFGAKLLVQMTVTVNILGTLLTPLMVEYFPSYMHLLVIRVLMGFGQGFLMPCASIIIAKWFSVNEKSTAMAIFSSGNQLSIVAAMFFTAKLCQLEFFGGWPSAFYLYSLFGVIFLIIWSIYMADRPKFSPFVSLAEFQHITGEVVKTRAMSIQLNTPYKQILTSPSILALCLSAFCQSFLMVALVTFLPQYYKSALGASLNTNGIMSALPFLVQLLGKMICATLADTVKKRQMWTIDRITKASNSIAAFGCAICLIWLAFLDGDQLPLIVLLLSLGMFLQCGYVAGYHTSIVSVAPNFAAAVAAYSQIYAHTGGTLAPVVIGMMTPKGTIDEWRLVFFVIAAILCGTGAFFQAFGTASHESWYESRPPIIKVAAPPIEHDGQLQRQTSALITGAALLRVPRTKKVSIREDSDWDDGDDENDPNGNYVFKEPLSMTDLSRL